MFTPSFGYRGRFAPSPTGYLHPGSLLTAVGSYLDAKAHQGKWLLRIEDIDPPREQKGAADHILHTLEAFGFEWDGAVTYQHQRLDKYEAVLQELMTKERAYPCQCSRRDIAKQARKGIEGWIYPGHCHRHPPRTPLSHCAWRFHVPEGMIHFTDRIQGETEQNVSQSIGDFVLKRADGFWAYQLAVVVDDADQQITHIVRGADLLGSTPRQIALQQTLHYSSPIYAHLPIIVNEQGNKLSKQTQAPTICIEQKEHYLKQALQWLGQTIDPECKTLAELWQWGIEHWHCSSIPSLPITFNSLLT